MLQAKYAKLRKKKKQVAAFKNQGNAKPEENQPSKVSTLSSTTKKSLGSMDAKEQAKKLIRSGTINLQPSRQRETNEKSTGFKRYASFYIMLSTQCGNFSVTKILREINFWEFRGSKIVVFAILRCWILFQARSERGSRRLPRERSSEFSKNCRKNYHSHTCAWK